MKAFRKIRILLMWPFRKLLYKEFGFKSDIDRADIICGRKHISILKDVKIRPRSRIEAISNYGGEVFSPNLHIGNNVTIEQGVHLTCSKELIIEDGVTISSYVYISDTSHSYSEINKNILQQPLYSNSTTIGKNSFIGTGTKILPGVIIGENVIIGANSVVNKNIPPYSVAVGNPAKVIKQFCNNNWVKV